MGSMQSELRALKAKNAACKEETEKMRRRNLEIQAKMRVLQVCPRRVLIPNAVTVQLFSGCQSDGAFLGFCSL